MKIIGRCYCGRIRYRAQGPVKHSGNCHCQNCRRAAGAQAVAWITVEKPTFRWTTGRPKRYRTSTKAWRTFCPACGTALTYESPRRPVEVDLTTGSLLHPEQFPPTRDYYAEERLPWVARVTRAK
jgi:hypothetical protein